MANKAQFEDIGSSIQIKDDKRNVVVLSRKKIIQENGSSSSFLVVKKLKVDSDGISSNLKQVFLPLAIAHEVFEKGLELLADDTEEESF